MGKIEVKNIRIYAFHGCLAEEAIIGSDYSVDVNVIADLSMAAISDNLEDTIDYVQINRIVKEEMKIRSKLLEHVAKRILDRIFLENNLVKEIRVCIAKLNPPIGGDVEAVRVVLQENRS